MSASSHEGWGLLGTHSAGEPHSRRHSAARPDRLSRVSWTPSAGREHDRGWSSWNGRTSLPCSDEYRRDADGGDSRVVLIAGEAGVGKTTLVEEFQPRTTDARWLWGACDGSLTPQPLAPLLGYRRPARGRAGQGVSGRGPAQKHGSFGCCATSSPPSDSLTVLVFEDVHWADEASLDLIQFLSRRVRELPVLILATYRDDALGRDHPLRPLLGEVGSHRWARRLSLPTLSSGAVSVLGE